MIPSVLVVGGGIAGLSCATFLHKMGISLQLLEASDRFGGRVETDAVGDYDLDVGFQVFLNAYPTARELLDLPSLNLRAFQAGALVHTGGRFRVLADPFRHPAMMLPSLMGPLALPDLLKLGKSSFTWKTQSIAEALTSRDQSSLSRLQELGFSEKAIVRFWRPFLGGIFLEEGLETSARMFEFVMSMFSRGRATIPKDGMQAIPDQLVSRLPREYLRTGVPVRELRARSVVLESGVEVEAEHVVDARDPWSLNPDDADACGTACFYFESDAPPWKHPWLVLCPECTHVQTLTDLSLLHPATGGPHLLSVSSPDLRVTESQIREDLVKMFGENANRWPMLKSYRIPKALPRQRVGHLNPASRSGKRSDGVYVCGDHMETASLEGAMLSGKRVAEHILALSARR